MQAFFLCWLFDRRWLCSLSNPCLQFILIVPLVVNLVSLTGMLYERSLVKVEVESAFIMLSTLYVFLSVLCLLLLVRIYFLSEEKLKDARENYEAIRYFTHNFEAKKGVWSWIGFCTAVLSLIQLGVNRYYINTNSQTYRCYTNLTRLYIDIAGWGYLALVAACFIVCKLVFLLMAWRNPEKYLKFKEVI